MHAVVGRDVGWNGTMDLQLKGKTALITGGSRGIGRGIALALARAGCTVALTARDAAALHKGAAGGGEAGGNGRVVAAEVEQAGGKAHVFVADLLREGAANEVAQAFAQKCGKLDILVNNAGAVRRGDFFK